jgi:hypothetical protein
MTVVEASKESDDHTRVVRGRAAAYQPDDRGEWSEQMPFSTLHGSGGLLTTADDLIRWTEALHADRVGKPGFLAEMTRTARLSDGRDLTYALGISVADYRGVREVSHGGSSAGYRAFLSYYAQAGLTVSIQCNAASADAGGLARSAAGIFLGDALQPASTPQAPVALSDSELQRRPEELPFLRHRRRGPCQCQPLQPDRDRQGQRHREPYAYLRSIFTDLPQATSIEQIEALLPVPTGRDTSTRRVDHSFLSSPPAQAMNIQRPFSLISTSV